jgi:hypothetical protein
VVVLQLSQLPSLRKTDAVPLAVEVLHHPVRHWASVTDGVGGDDVIVLIGRRGLSLADLGPVANRAKAPSTPR